MRVKEYIKIMVGPYNNNNHYQAIHHPDFYNIKGVVICNKKTEFFIDVDLSNKQLIYKPLLNVERPPSPLTHFTLIDKDYHSYGYQDLPFWI